MVKEYHLSISTGGRDHIVGDISEAVYFLKE